MKTAARRQKIYNMIKHHDINCPLSVSEILERLKSDGIEMCRRTIDRDLEALESTHKLIVNEDYPKTYYVDKSYTPEYKLTLSDKELQVVVLALASMKQNSSSYFQNLCMVAEDRIHSKLPDGTAKNLLRFKELSHTNFGIPGQSYGENDADIELVMKALRDSKDFYCKLNSPYRTNEENARNRHFAPILIKIASGAPYLYVEDLEQEGAIKNIRLTRIHDVKLGDQTIEPHSVGTIKGDKNVFGGWGGDDTEEIDYEIECRGSMARYFEEHRFSEDQKVEEISGDLYRVTFTQNDSFELVSYLSRFGGELVNISPPSIKEQVVSIWKEGLSNLAS